ncbi:EsaB/YukD family protein [Actinomadura sp. 9N407]|uniref:EsaB/YukD family protein n=1 Tax=Actinomadura sp. 9N407 TaxID=3375154 RepID=UPI0037AD3721
MTGAFTRLTVAGPAARVDMSIPGDVTVAETLRLIGAPDAERPRRWVLEHPVKGPLAPDSSLSAAGVLDGETLYLRPDDDGPLAPYSEDAAEDAAALADAAPGAWSPALTQATSAAILAIWLGLFGPVLIWRYGATTQVMTAIGTVAGIAAGTAVSARRLLRIPFATGLAYGLIVLVVSFAVAAAELIGLERSGAVCAGALALVVAVVPALWLGPPLAPVTAGTGCAALFVAAWSGPVALGLPVVRGAATTVLLGIVVAGFLPRAAVEGTGLGRIADQVMAGGAVRRNDVKAAARHARTTLAWTLAGLAVPCAVALAVLAGASGLWPLATAVTFASVLWLRARTFGHASHILVLTAAAVMGLLAVAFAQVQHVPGPALPTAIALAVGLVLTICAAVRLPEITRIRLRTILDRVELLAMIACGPLLLGVFNAYAWAAGLGGS